MRRLVGIDARVADRLRELRSASGLTHEQLAERAGLSTRFIGKLERGESRGSLETWDQVARALGMPLADFFVAPTVSTRASGAREASKRYGATDAQLTVLTSLARALDRRALAALITIAREMTDKPRAT